MGVVLNLDRCSKHNWFAKGFALFVLIFLLLFSSCNYNKSSQDLEGASFEGFSKEETIAWIQKKLENDLVYSYGKIESVRVEPCYIFYGYEMGSLSGLSSMVEQDIPTDDFRIKRDGSILYTIEGVRSNCSTIDDNEMALRVTASEIKVRRLGSNGHHRLMRAIEYLNSFCKEEV